MIESLVRHLEEEDDAALWQVVLDTIFADLALVQMEPKVLVEVGRCSHWLRPHQTRWTADGGFAHPTGYGKPGTGGYSRLALPQFDWSVVLEGSGSEWCEAVDKSGKWAVRVTIPSRTKRHLQAAIHTLWARGRDQERRFYGFRKKNGVWSCTAATDWNEDRWEALQFATPDPVLSNRPRIGSEAEWLTCEDPSVMTGYVWKQVSNRKMRLFALACCHRILEYMRDERSRRAVEVSERFAEGVASEEELAQAFDDACVVPESDIVDEATDEFVRHHPNFPTGVFVTAKAADAAFSVCFGTQPVANALLKDTASDVADVVYGLHGFSHAARTQEMAEHSCIVRDIFGNPFRPITLDPSLVTPAVTSLATTIYDDRRFDRMPELADALEETGCAQTEILEHCRELGPHVRGCWVIDLLLGKE
jgi:hypothetical protein